MAKQGNDYVRAIRESGLTIYNRIEIEDPNLWIPDSELEELLRVGLHGMSVDMPNRTRSKAVKANICKALGYPVPNAFKKTKPRFVGQNFDTYVQKSNNLQIWNEEISPTRRYVLLRASGQRVITHVKVINGVTLALLDKTGTLTQKYQAAVTLGEIKRELVVLEDTENLRPLIAKGDVDFSIRRATDEPKSGELVSIEHLFDILSDLVGRTFDDAGQGQERNRGGALHELICRELGYLTFSDNGQLPDILDQLLEVKLQLARTIDLGLVCPDSQMTLTNTPSLESRKIRYCDLRYAVFCGTSDGQKVTLTHFFLTTGESFFTKFRRFEGQVVNKKIQIPLPRNLFPPQTADD
jgi:hypothetical protein